MAFRAQGATEYLVLLAVVLVIALVGIALLGFFPGTASDAQARESEIYWESASPVAILEMGALDYASQSGNMSMLYLRLKNSGSYPVRITAMLGGTSRITQIYCDTSCDGTAGYKNFGDVYYMAPGEERIYSHSSFPGTPYRGGNGVILGSDGFRLTGASICNNANSSSKGTVAVNGFGFEYIQYVEGQQITKRQIGAKPLIIKCS